MITINTSKPYLRRCSYSPHALNVLQPIRRSPPTEVGDQNRQRVGVQSSLATTPSGGLLPSVVIIQKTRKDSSDGRLHHPNVPALSRVLALLITLLVAALGYLRFAPDSSTVSVPEGAGGDLLLEPCHFPTERQLRRRMRHARRTGKRGDPQSHDHLPIAILAKSDHPREPIFVCRAATTSTA